MKDDDGVGDGKHTQQEQERKTIKSGRLLKVRQTCVLDSCST